MSNTERIQETPETVEERALFLAVAALKVNPKLVLETFNFDANKLFMLGAEAAGIEIRIIRKQERHPEKMVMGPREIVELGPGDIITGVGLYK